mmetsp:Transcript_32216/g.70815  ORF Transcript_32216/g.70815 Transcript_32216/m.70815 type:complete len:365 (+) Transcript_32216:258-1352(+)
MASSPPPASSPPISLKGITSTNDDPDACAFCSDPFFMVDLERKINGAVNICCGKSICLNCNDYDRTFIGAGRSKRCSFCNSPAIVGDKGNIGALKKHAKKGAAWAQFVLGNWFEYGSNSLSKSEHDAKRWYEKAAKQGHPEAMVRLGNFYLDGVGGCTVNLSKAREYAEKAMSLDGNVVDLSLDLLLEISDRVGPGEAKSILVPLAENGIPRAQLGLGAVFALEDNFLAAKKWFEASALQGNEAADRVILSFCSNILNMPETNFWFNIVYKPGMTLDVVAQELQESTGRRLRQLRDNCGGCGIKLDGDRRKYCKQCRTYCYCSRECQKLHWSRTEGHRSECMAVRALEEKIEMTTSRSSASSAK